MDFHSVFSTLIVCAIRPFVWVNWYPAISHLTCSQNLSFDYFPFSTGCVDTFKNRRKSLLWGILVLLLYVIKSILLIWRESNFKQNAEKTFLNINKIMTVLLFYIFLEQLCKQNIHITWCTTLLFLLLHYFACVLWVWNFSIFLINLMLLKNVHTKIWFYKIERVL